MITGMCGGLWSPLDIAYPPGPAKIQNSPANCPSIHALVLSVLMCLCLPPFMPSSLPCIDPLTSRIPSSPPVSAWPSCSHMGEQQRTQVRRQMCWQMLRCCSPSDRLVAWPMDGRPLADAPSPSRACNTTPTLSCQLPLTPSAHVQPTFSWKQHVRASVR